MAKTTVGRLAFHVHHDALVERLTEPIEVRQEYIRENKPASERKTRLRLLRLVKGPLPTAVVKALAARNTAGDAWEKARRAAYDEEGAAREAHPKTVAAYAKALAALGKVWNAYKQTCQEHAAEIEALHRKECPNCPWDGKTIFPNKDAD